jgi:hypothetical protein
VTYLKDAPQERGMTSTNIPGREGFWRNEDVINIEPDPRRGNHRRHRRQNEKGYQFNIRRVVKRIDCAFLPLESREHENNLRSSGTEKRIPPPDEKTHTSFRARSAKTGPRGKDPAVSKAAIRPSEGPFEDAERIFAVIILVIALIVTADNRPS